MTTSKSITGKLTKKQNNIINDICELQEQMKDIKEIMDRMKDSIDLPAGKYITNQKHTLNVVDVQIYADITPVDMHTALKRMKIGKRWVECVKVNLTMLKKVLPGNVIEDLREEKCIQVRSTYK